MSLIRICDAPNLRKWDKEPCDPAPIVKEWFSPDRDPNPSLYWASSIIEEVEIAAAHSLTDLGPSLKPAYLLRIELSDLTASSADKQLSDKNPGTTGVVRVDFLHRELLEAGSCLDDLVRVIWERYEAGEQRFRWVGPPVLRRQLALFCSLSDREVIQEAKRRCRHKLGGGAVTLRGPRGPEIRAQLRAAPPQIPAQVIREHAYRLYQSSGRQDDFANWQEAEQKLLEEYEAGFIRVKSPPT